MGTSYAFWNLLLYRDGPFCAECVYDSLRGCLCILALSECSFYFVGARAGSSPHAGEASWLGSEYRTLLSSNVLVFGNIASI